MVERVGLHKKQLARPALVKKEKLSEPLFLPRGTLPLRFEREPLPVGAKSPKRLVGIYLGEQRIGRLSEEPDGSLWATLQRSKSGVHAYVQVKCSNVDMTSVVETMYKHLYGVRR